MSSGFVHSIPVPRLYKTAAKTVRQVTEEGASLKQLIYERKHPNLKGVYALATTTLQNGAKLNEIIRKTQLLFKEPRFDPWLARVLITELIWGKGVLKNDSKPVQTILTYENEIRQQLQISTPEESEEEPKKRGQKARYIRINTLVKSVGDAIEGFKGDGYELLPKPKRYEDFLETVRNLGNWPYLAFIQDFHVDELFAFPPGTHFYDHPGYQCGAIVLQDKASCLPAYLLNPKPCSVVLDMCAAPGMKTTHLAAILQNRGKVLSVERNERRYQVLCEMVKTANAACVETLNLDALTLTPEVCGDVEYILVDPSCSGSGMDRPDFEDNNGRCAPGRLKRLQSFQVLLLRHALLNFPKVKRVIYSTCSMYPEENEMVVDEILGDIGQAYKLVPIRELLKDQWINFSSKDYQCGDNCLYARPDVDQSNGFFVALFDRNPDVPLPERHKKKITNGKSTGKNGEETGGENEADEIWRDKKCKKKKKSKKEADVEEVDPDKIHESMKKVNISGEVENESMSLGTFADDGITGENSLTEEIIESKRKKKHRKNKVQEEISTPGAENDSHYNPQIVNGITEFEKKKKKKKRAHDELTESDPVDGDQAHEKLIETEDKDGGPAKKSKKMKKKKYEEREYTSVDGELGDETQISKKKKERKRKQEKEVPEFVVDVTVSMDIPSIDEELPKDSPKTKKKKKCEAN